MIKCPACLPPHNQTCATCGGSNEVTEEVYSQFMEEKQELESSKQLRNKIQEALRFNRGLEELSLAIKEIIKDY
jgi:hypothetical protein